MTAPPVRGAVPLETPQGWEPWEVAPRTWCVRVPVNLPVQYTHCFVVEGSNGCLVVDPGWDSAAGASVVRRALTSARIPTDRIVGVVATHAHRDHLGLAPDVAALAGPDCWVALHEEELRDHEGAATREQWRAREEDWLDALGVPPLERDAARIPDEGVDSVLRTTHADRRLRDGDTIDLGDRRLRVLHTPGHSPGSICLVDESHRLILTGDTLLPRITPNVGWAPHGPPDPLGDFRHSLAELARFADWTALPGHEWPFTGIGTRVVFLLDHHAERDREVLATLERVGATDAWTLATTLTWSRSWDALSGFQRRIAAAETAAHLQNLLRAGRVRQPVYGRYSSAIVAMS